jgi:4-hydroxybenzoate polyprenyltransferase
MVGHMIPWRALLDMGPFKRSVGVYYILWPLWTTLWMASNGHPSVKHVTVFTLGALWMYWAGCLFNDYWDCAMDRLIPRTQKRPIARGSVRPSHALTAGFVCCIMASILLLWIPNTWFLACISAAVSLLYPLSKRWLCCPQIILGFGWQMGILMVYQAVQQHIPMIGYGLYVTAAISSIACDTLYALMDCPWDKTLGIGSFAVWLGPYAYCIAVMLYGVVACLWWFIGYSVTHTYYTALWLISTLWFVRLLWQTRFQTQSSLQTFFNRAHWYNFFIGLSLIISFKI